MFRILCLLVLIGSMSGMAQQPGAAIYAKRCASCHESGAVRIPSRAQLQSQTGSAILRALNSGVMKQQAASMSRVDRLTVSRWLGRKTSIAVDASKLANRCKDAGIPPLENGSASWTSWGGGLANLRFQPADAAGLTPQAVGQLKLKWAFAAPDATSMRSQPAIYRGRIIVGAGRWLYALDASSGCTYWATDLPAGARSGIIIASLKGKAVVFFGDPTGAVRAIDFATGKPVWHTHVDSHPTAMVTGTPVYYDGKLFVPVASYEEGAALERGYLCCTFRGSVVALDANTGKMLWKTYTVATPDASIHTNNHGARSMGPSGVGVWSAPTIDKETGMLYVATGDNYSDPATDKSDSVIALSMDTGTIVWSKQFRSGDAFNNACIGGNSANCPDAAGSDFDFGSSPILLSLPGGQRALILAQKSGAVFAIDPDSEGELIWQAQIGKGGVLGGIEWGPAADGNRLYAAVSDEAFLDPVREELDPNVGGGIFALQLINGDIAWETPAAPCDSHRPCSPAQQAAVTAIPGVVFSGSMDGHLRAYSTENGIILWDYNTIHDYSTVNGLPGRGGSLNVAGPVIADGMVFAISGYDQAGAAPGNVLLAFSPGVD
jgi:polyvinyl alcohol dehydrogenase (cytochrome)